MYEGNVISFIQCHAISWRELQPFDMALLFFKVFQAEIILHFSHFFFFSRFFFFTMAVQLNLIRKHMSLPFCSFVISLSLTNIYSFCPFFCQQQQMSEYTLLSANIPDNCCLFSKAVAMCVLFSLCSLLTLRETGSIAA